MAPNTGTIYLDNFVGLALDRGETLVDLHEAEAQTLVNQNRAQRRAAGKRMVAQGRAYRRDPATGLKVRA